MAYHKRITQSGRLVEEAVYMAPNGGDAPTVRRARRKHTDQIHQRFNDKRSRRQLERILACNFDRGDLFATFTFDDEHLPKKRAEAMKAVRSFLGKINRARAKQGQELVYVYCLEHVHGEGRWHAHMVLNATGEDYELLRKKWTWGSIEEFRPICIDREHTYEALAIYMTKEPREKPSDRQFICSQNCRRPEHEVSRCRADEKISIPKRAAVLEDSGEVVTVYGRYRYVKYLLPPLKRKAKARRHRSGS